MTTKTKKKRCDSLFDFFRHPRPSFGHLTSVRLTMVLLGMVWLAGAALAPEPAGGAQHPGNSHAHDFLIFATVFNDRGFAFYGARVRVRRAEEKKFRWEAMSDHHGELGIRVPQDAEYEMTIEARGFQPQTRKIDAREGNRVDLTIRMEPQRAPQTKNQSEKGTGGKS